MSLTPTDVGLASQCEADLRIKQLERGLDEASLVESFLVLNVLGGGCLDDFERLREDVGLAEMVGHEMPTPMVARTFLYAFHDEERIEAAQQELPVGQVSYIPTESAPLRALAQVNQDLVQEAGRRCADQKIATVDLDSTVIESWKREAKPTYEGDRGYQPMLARWPGRVRPGVSDSLFSQVDFLATFAALTGEEIASETASDSLNMLDALLGESETGREQLIEHAGSLSLRDGLWKLIYPSNGRRMNTNTNTELDNDAEPQLYELGADIAETSNLAGEHLERVRSMMERIEAERQP